MNISLECFIRWVTHEALAKYVVAVNTKLTDAIDLVFFQVHVKSCLGEKRARERNQCFHAILLEETFKKMLVRSL